MTGIVVPNNGTIGSASDTDAIAISSSGAVTFSKDINPNNFVGMIAPFAMATPPTGWLACDGSNNVSKTTYADLYNALTANETISNPWGSGADSSTFALPDLDGAFLRGTGTGTINSRNKPGPSVGSFQEDELQAHAHKISGFTGTGSGGSDKLHAVNYTTPYGGQQIHWMGHTFMEMKTGGGGSQDVRSNDETFPYNAGVKYCIKY